MYLIFKLLPLVDALYDHVAIHMDDLKSHMLSRERSFDNFYTLYEIISFGWKWQCIDMILKRHYHIMLHPGITTWWCQSLSNIARWHRLEIHISCLHHSILYQQCIMYACYSPLLIVFSCCLPVTKIIIVCNSKGVEKHLTCMIAL